MHSCWTSHSVAEACPPIVTLGWCLFICRWLEPISALPFRRSSQTLAHLLMSSHATESTRLIEFLGWVEVNKKKLVIGAALVAVGIGAWAIYQWNRNQAETEASAALFKVDKPGARSQTALEANAQAFLQVATAHPGTSAGARALLLAADALFRENKYTEAKAQFENFLRDDAEHPLAATAALGVAACLDAMDKTNEALTAYQDVASRFAGSAAVAQAKLGLARLYEAKNDPAQALRIYEELTRPNASSAWSSEAAMRREQLLSKHPELAKSNAPVATISSIIPKTPPAAKLTPLTGTNPVPVKPANPR